ncbi:hypothetical protein SPB21_07210 [Leptothoe sp. ISB3NOV94-8A]
MPKKSRVERIAELLIEGVVFAAQAKDKLETYDNTFRKCTWNLESGEIDVDCISWAKFKRFIEAELPGYGKGYFESDKCKDRFGKSRFDAYYLTGSIDFLEKYQIAKNSIKEGQGSKPITFKLKNFYSLPSNTPLNDYAVAQIKAAYDRQALDKSSSSTGEVARPSQNVSQIQSTSKRGNPVYPIGSRKIDGRDREIDELHLKLQESVENKDNLTAVNVCGIGGIGKTELCIHYIKNYEVKFYKGLAKK